ncbi:Rha family transcriptional regulator [Paenibacillus bouchesdurhonensis]|uniref:Rha family transcriptional regulator n=1 Tax=Paenibacillus bouchesdurhonensis TaxID=1870990 RepID=UPI000DA5F055|nr:Rha family transcriptional regulator [Paenibacillus bouchesdurhonensis]
MNQLQNKTTISSLEVAEMMEIKHYQVLEKLEGTKTIKGIIPTMTDHKIMVSEYFIESSYTDASGRSNKCYELTKMGCEFLANKYTGEKGILFTAKYVKRFNEMEEAQAVSLTGLSPQLQILIQQEQQIKQIKTQVDTLTNGLTATPDHTKVVQRVNEYARWTRTGHNEVYNKIHDVMKARFGIDVKARVENERDRINHEYFERTGKHYSLSTLKGKVNGIDVMVRMGVLDKFNEILVGMLATVKKIS